MLRNNATVKKNGGRNTAPRAKAQPSTKADGGALPKQKKAGRIDVPLFTLVMILLLFGLVMLFSASYAYSLLSYGDSFAIISNQMKYAIVGLVAMFGASMVDYHFLRRFAWPLMVVTLLMLMVVLFMQPGVYGGRRWIWLNGSHSLSMQPSEIAKFALILLFASLITTHQSRIKTFKYGFLPFAIILGAIAGLLILEPHLSCTILVLGIGISMMYIGGTSVKWFGFAAIVAVAALYLVLTSFPNLVPYAAKRVEVWLDPLHSTQKAAYQVRQSLIAVGSGGRFGKGIGKSVQKFLYLPEMHNDYIFAVLCEELGLLGAGAVIVLFLLLLGRGLFVAMRAKDKFGTMLVIGIIVQIALQAFLHIAVNINAIPSTGISMPFFSSGGTSLVMLMGQVGIILSVSRQADLAFVRAATVAEPAQAEEEMQVDTETG